MYDDDDDDENDNDDDDDSYMGCVVVHVDIIVNLSNFNTASNSDPIATIQIVGVCKSISCTGFADCGKEQHIYLPCEVMRFPVVMVV